ncbi:AraC family transcriptional regulator [Flavobacterium sp. 3-218]
MIPQLTTLSKLNDCLAFMKLPDNYLNNTDFVVLKLHEMGIHTPCQSPTFRPDFYNLTIVVRGSGTCIVGNETFELRSNHIFISKPDSFLSSSWTNITKVYNICFSKDFVLEYLPEGIDAILESDKSNGYIEPLTKETMLYFEETCLEIYALSNSVLSYKQELISNLTLNLLFLIQLQSQERKKQETRTNKYPPIVTAFRQNLEENFNSLLKGKNASIMRTKEHAKLLNLNENHLCKVVSNSTNKTINDWINEKLIDEINYLLKHSDKSIKEIAGLFAFNDINSFYSYFKSHTLIAPSAVRKEFLINNSNHKT